MAEAASHPALNAQSVAVITGGAAGIGLAAACRFGAQGMRVVLVDLGADRLATASALVSDAGALEVMVAECDVSDRAAVEALEASVTARFGGADIVMSNAGIQPGSALFSPVEVWRKILEVNLWGMIHCAQVFAPGMIARGRPGMIINSGSKQGITTPPGDPAYNVAKTGVKSFTEALEHELRNSGGKISAHLLIPGFVFTELTRNGRTEKPDAAWTPDQIADFMVEALNNGDFYVLCPDNDVDRVTDEKRMAWAMGDVINNRPPLSRWHPDYGDAFAQYMKE